MNVASLRTRKMLEKILVHHLNVVGQKHMFINFCVIFFCISTDVATEHCHVVDISEIVFNMSVLILGCVPESVRFRG